MTVSDRPAVRVSGEYFTTRDATIADSETASSSVPTYGGLLVGFITDSGLNGTAMGLQASIDDSTFLDVNDPVTGDPLAWVVAASGFYLLSPPLLVAQYIKFVSGTAETGATVVTAVFAP